MKRIRIIPLLMLLLAAALAVLARSAEPAPQADLHRVWWKEAVVYQIYPRSFKDSDGDGIGDLRGIIEKLDYIKSLGIDVVWLNPIYASPNDDNGYDISDYRAIMREFGTMEDFDALVAGMHERGIKLVMDLVPNHSSSEHEWFRQARSSRDNPCRDYYHWWPVEKGTPPKRWSFFDVEGNAWKYDAPSNSYYLHYFAEKQPDLNWENPAVRREIYETMRFWFKRGVDGFRMDVVPFISKDTTFPELPAAYRGDFVKYYANGPRLHEYLQEMNREVLSQFDVMTVGEGIGVTAGEAGRFVDPDRKELNMIYHFDGMGLGYLPGEFKAPDPKGYDLVEFKDIYTRWDAALAEKGWGTIYLGNHDQPRMVTRWGNDSAAYRELSAKMLTTFLLTMRGTPYYYFGDELGMSNIKFDRIDDYRDIESINMYRQVEANGGDVRRFLENQKISARDNGRTPFQWDDSAHAGFSTGEPWLKVNPNYTTVNVARQAADPDSVLNYFRRAIRLRKGLPALVYGRYTLLDRTNPKTYACLREQSDTRVLVMLNFTAEPASVELGDIVLTGGEVLLGNYPAHSAPTRELRPYEAMVIKLK